MPGRFELTSTPAKIWHAPDHFRLPGPAASDAPPGNYRWLPVGYYRYSASLR